MYTILAQQHASGSPCNRGKFAQFEMYLRKESVAIITEMLAEMCQTTKIEMKI